MMAHHARAVMMANTCLAKAETEAVLGLCQSIIEQQMAETSELQN
ncbi:MAG: DUF305 domain-containing protein [Anaerolineae bacterium]|nr:DUF305 domain-containing protein [Anaerolineae bacterium]